MLPIDMIDGISFYTIVAKLHLKALCFSVSSCALTLRGYSNSATGVIVPRVNLPLV
jgi:hypothetical protein